MSNRFHNPRPQFFNSTPTVYSGGKLYFYAAGTSDPLATYSDSTLATANANPVVLNSAGRPDSDIFLSDAAYKVVLKDSSDTTIWTADPYSTSDYTATAQFQVYAGNPNSNVAGTAGSGSIPADVVWDTTNNILYVCTTTGTASTAVWTAVNASAAVPSVPAPQGRLTLTSGTPVLSTGVAAGTTLYYTPFIGNLIPLYNSTSTAPVSFSELSLSLVASHAANTIYDVFVFSNSGVNTLVTGPAWSTVTAGSGARGTGAGTTQLTRLNGFYVNAVSMTGRNGSTTYSIGANLATYVGSILMDGSNGQLTCHTAVGQSRKHGVWNAYNRVRTILQVQDSTASWTYATATVRSSNNAAGNTAALFCGLAEEWGEAIFRQNVANSGATSGTPPYIGIGVNSTSAVSGQVAYMAEGNVSLNTAIVVAAHRVAPTLGLNNINCVESSEAVTTTFYGSNRMMMTLDWWS